MRQLCIISDRKARYRKENTSPSYSSYSLRKPRQHRRSATSSFFIKNGEKEAWSVGVTVEVAEDVGVEVGESVGVCEGVEVGELVGVCEGVEVGELVPGLFFLKYDLRVNIFEVIMMTFEFVPSGFIFFFFLIFCINVFLPSRLRLNFGPQVVIYL